MSQCARNSSDPLRDRLLEGLIDGLRREADQRRQRSEPGWKRILRNLRNLFGGRSHRPIKQQPLAA